MTQHPINPYQPVASVDQENAHALSEIHFRLTQRILRCGESKYLIQSHSSLLVLGSLLIITLSTVIFIAAMYYGEISFFRSIIGTMVASALGYLALVHRAKIEVRQNLKKHGMVDGAVCSIFMGKGQVTINTPAGTFHWPASTLRTYKTQKGHLLLPQEPIFAIIPKVNEATRAEYKQLIKAIKYQPREYSE